MEIGTGESDCNKGTLILVALLTAIRYSLHIGGHHVELENFLGNF